MLSVTLSICLPPEEAAMLRAYGKDGGNISALMARLVRAHFGQGGGGPNMAGVMSAELEGRISSLQDEIGRLTADMEMFRINTEEAKKMQAEKAASLDDAIRSAFSEMEEGGLEGWREDVTAAEISRYSIVRAGLIASREGISEAEAKAAILRIYPDLEGYL